MDDREWLRELAALISERERPREQADGELNILALLAEDPRNGLIELAPGVYTVDRGPWGATR
jgi:hypothetical protein